MDWITLTGQIYCPGTLGHCWQCGSSLMQNDTLHAEIRIIRAIYRFRCPICSLSLTLLTYNRLISWPALPIISLVMPHSWCKCQSCLLSGLQGHLFSKPDYKIHQLWLQCECDNQQVAAHAAAEKDLFMVVVVDPGSNLNNMPSAMWNSWERVQAQASFSADNTPTISSATSVIAEGVHSIALLSHSTDSSPFYVTDDLVAAFDHLGIRGPHRTGKHMSLADPQQPITSLDTKTSSSPVDAPTTDPVVEGVCCIAPFFHSIDSSPSCVTNDLVTAFDQLGVNSLSPPLIPKHRPLLFMHLLLIPSNIPLTLLPAATCVFLGPLMTNGRIMSSQCILWRPWQMLRD